MIRPTVRKTVILLGAFLGLWIALQYLLPLLLPFVLGGALALAAEPLVQFLSGRLRLRRGIAAGIGVSMTIALLLLALLLLAGLAVKELSRLSAVLPLAQRMVHSGLMNLRELLLSLAGRLPDGISGLLTQTVLELFSGSAALISRVSGGVLGAATGLLGSIPNGTLALATGVISGYMICAKLPGIRSFLRKRVPPAWRERYLPSIQAVRYSLLSYLKAQCKLAAVTFAIVTGGLLILGIPTAPVWAALISLVDAVPLLGTGTVMLPWALVCLLQQQRIRALGLLGIYVAAALTRSILEPRLVGRHLGIDPLVTLIALYLGFRLWGVLGMLIAPMAAATAIQVADMTQAGATE